MMPTDSPISQPEVVHFLLGATRHKTSLRASSPKETRVLRTRKDVKRCELVSRFGFALEFWRSNMFVVIAYTTSSLETLITEISKCKLTKGGSHYFHSAICSSRSCHECWSQRPYKFNFFPLRNQFFCRKMSMFFGECFFCMAP